MPTPPASRFTKSSANAADSGKPCRNGCSPRQQQADGNCDNRGLRKRFPPILDEWESGFSASGMHRDAVALLLDRRRFLAR
jgi:hypothetical protein